MRKATFKWLHTVEFHFYDLLKKVKLWKQKMDQQCPGVGGGIFYKEPPEKIRGNVTVLYIDFGSGYRTL